MMRRRMSLALAIVVSSLVVGRGELIEGNDLVVLRHVTVIDGTGAPPLPDAVVVIDGDRIVQVGRESELRFGEGSRVEDLPGRWVVPGFVDMHAQMPDPANQPRFLAALLASGITTARSTGAVPETGVLLRERRARGDVQGSQLLTAGALTDGPDSFWDFAVKVRTANEVRAEVRRQAAGALRTSL